MIAARCLTRDWIMRQRELHHIADPHLIERQIRAFALVASLQESGTPFVFKGGTSLLLLLPEARRLSIDIDIIGRFAIEDLRSMASSGGFLRVDHDARNATAVPKEHYKFVYHSALDGREAYILLDVLSADHGYPQLQELPLTSPILHMEEELLVTVPTINGILGDKLTAFAPRTIGVPHGAGKSMEIVKQLFDIGELFGSCDDLEELDASYRSHHRQQVAFHAMATTVEAALEDTIDASFLLCQSHLRGSAQTDIGLELHKGIQQIQGYVLGRPFRLEEARRAAARAAFVASLLKHSASGLDAKGRRYDPTMASALTPHAIEGDFSIINRLKRSQPETFYYWWLISRM